MLKKIILLLTTFPILFLSCNSTGKIQTEELSKPMNVQENILRLSFAGDIMAHTEVTGKNFSGAFADIEDILKNSDFSFANFESPVNNAMPQSSYPTFNCHEDYAKAAMDAGFNVFSLANNHTNDFYEEGMNSTRNFFDGQKPLGIYSCGIKEKKDDDIKFITIEKNGWKILFASITEVLNFKRGTELFDYLPPENKAREKFLEQINREKRKSSCDFLVLSFHTAEEEYVTSIAEKSKKFYYSLLDSGVDILWINHPHVSKDWAVITNRSTRESKVIFYSVGNTISGQRRKPNFDKPDSPRDNSGDSFIFNMEIEKSAGGIRIRHLKPVLITTFINEGNFFVIKKLNEEFIQTLKDQGNFKWAQYLSERKKIMNKIEGKYSWQ